VLYWADLQLVHGFCCYDNMVQSVPRFHCYDNIAPNAKCQRVLVLALCLCQCVLLYAVCIFIRTVAVVCPLFPCAVQELVSWINVSFQHKCGCIRDECWTGTAAVQWLRLWTFPGLRRFKFNSGWHL